MNILKLFGLKNKNTDNPSNKDILYLWEDDNLMIELLPNENIDFIKQETRRIKNFADDHFDGSGFTNITPIGEKPFKTIQKLIDISEIESIMNEAGLKRVLKFHIQGIGLVKKDKIPIGFGTSKFALMLDNQGKLLEHIWITGHIHNDQDRKKLIKALQVFGQTYGFVGVNWFHGEYYNLIETEVIEEFVNTSC